MTLVYTLYRSAINVIHANQQQEILNPVTAELFIHVFITSWYNMINAAGRILVNFIYILHYTVQFVNSMFKVNFL